MSTVRGDCGLTLSSPFLDMVEMSAMTDVRCSQARFNVLNQDIAAGWSDLESRFPATQERYECKGKVTHSDWFSLFSNQTSSIFMYTNFLSVFFNNNGNTQIDQTHVEQSRRTLPSMSGAQCSRRCSRVRQRAKHEF
jgi:hypothetical protein